MAIKLTITVADIAATLAAGYTHIIIYRSAEYDTGFTEITTSSSRVALQAGVSVYTFYDYNATTEHWYRTTFYKSSTAEETTASAAFKGTFEDKNYSTITYPEEATFTNNDYYVIDKVRALIGDKKELVREYISEAEGGFDNVSADGHTYSLANPRGWPLHVSHSGYTYDSTGASVNDFQSISISGTIDTSSGSTDVFDVWYYHFRNSDSEILRVFNGLTVPPQLTEDQVTFELSVICAAIEILSQELRLANATSSAEVDIFQEIRINPGWGLNSRLNDLENLKKQRDKLIDEILAESAETDIYGVLID